MRNCQNQEISWKIRRLGASGCVYSNHLPRVYVYKQEGRVRTQPINAMLALFSALIGQMTWSRGVLCLETVGRPLVGTGPLSKQISPLRFKRCRVQQCSACAWRLVQVCQAPLADILRYSIHLKRADDISGRLERADDIWDWGFPVQTNRQVSISTPVETGLLSVCYFCHRVLCVSSEVCVSYTTVCISKRIKGNTRIVF